MSSLRREATVYQDVNTIPEQKEKLKNREENRKLTNLRQLLTFLDIPNPIVDYLISFNHLETEQFNRPPFTTLQENCNSTTASLIVIGSSETEYCIKQFLLLLSENSYSISTSSIIIFSETEDHSRQPIEPL
ncbi:7929_t:CDS:2 [Racocetra persica]|uniref:7929_t:CDS:1 n=1 Tax=Racocetra persica TaxID=160502 RepID=A0ACA9NSX9_9GLOM|nr:7929_t:CDS:2 [Racocetra persica]